MWALANLDQFDEDALAELFVFDENWAQAKLVCTDVEWVLVKLVSSDEKELKRKSFYLMKSE